MLRCTRTTVVLAALSLLTLLAPIRASAQAPADDVDTLVASVLRSARYPALVVSVRKGDETLYEAAHGLADLEHEAPATPDTVFQIGSLTKSFTSLLVARLAIEGAIDLDAPVSDYLPDYSGPAADVPVRHLMNHTAGIVNYIHLPDFPRGDPRRMSRGDMRAYFEAADLMFAPGDAFLYSNSGYYILGLIIESVTGIPYEEALKSRILAPLGLTRTYMGALEPIIVGRAEGYALGAGGVVNAPQLDPLVPFAAGALLSTVQDIQTCIHKVHRENVFGDDVRGILYLRDRLNDGTALEYALGGLIVRLWEGREKIAHLGDIDGFSAYMSFYPDEDVSIVVMANMRDITPSVVGIEQKIARILFGAAQPVPSGHALDADEVRSLAGDFDAGVIQVGIPRIGIIAGDHSLAFRFGGAEAAGPAIPLVHLRDRTFAAAHDDEMIFVFTPNDGQADRLTVDWLGGGIPFDRASASATKRLTP